MGKDDDDRQSTFMLSLPYLIVGSFFILLQMAYLIFYKGRVSGFMKTISSFESPSIVNIISFFVIAVVMGTPFLIYLIMGIHLAAEEKFVGIYVLLVISVHMLVLSALFWYMRRWRLSLFVKT